MAGKRDEFFEMQQALKISGHMALYALNQFQHAMPQGKETAQRAQMIPGYYAVKETAFRHDQASILGRVAICYSSLGNEGMAREYARKAASEYFIAHPDDKKE